MKQTFIILFVYALSRFFLCVNEDLLRPCFTQWTLIETKFNWKLFSFRKISDVFLTEGAGIKKTWDSCKSENKSGLYNLCSQCRCECNIPGWIVER